MPGLDAPIHWLIILIVLMALFGYRKLPDVSRSVGRSLRIFKTEMKALTTEEPTASAGTELPSLAPYPGRTEGGPVN